MNRTLCFGWSAPPPSASNLPPARGSYSSRSTRNQRRIRSALVNSSHTRSGGALISMLRRTASSPIFVSTSTSLAATIIPYDSASRFFDERPERLQRHQVPPALERLV